MENVIPFEVLIEQAKEGRIEALEALIRSIQSLIYNLALRMLQDPADAEDASQEILIKVITHLSEFRQESSFKTWVYRIATNYLLTTRKRRAEQRYTTFQELGNALEASLARGEDVEDDLEHHLLIEEVKLNCTLGMLLCLDRELRITLILGHIFEVTSEEGAMILEITPAAFRKRLSRARKRLTSFIRNRCGLIEAANPCKCSRHVRSKINAGLLDSERLLYATAEHDQTATMFIQQKRRQVQEMTNTAGLLRIHPQYAAPGSLVKNIRKLLGSEAFNLLEQDSKVL